MFEDIWTHLKCIGSNTNSVIWYVGVDGEVQTLGLQLLAFCTDICSCLNTTCPGQLSRAITVLEIPQ